jgi:predicted nucleic acid-binding protein
VGINKAVPTVALDVVGDVVISDDFTVDTDTLRVDAVTDRVGINVSAPDASLHVVGNAHVQNTTEAFSTVTGAMTIAGGLGVTANVHATQFHGDGSKLTGLVTTLEDVANNGNTMSNVIIFENATTGLVTDGKVGVSTRAPNANLHVVGNVHVADTTEAFSTVTGAVTITGGMGVVGNVHAAQYHGDGSKLTGLVTTLEDVANNGNTMSNVIIFENETTGLVTDGRIGVSTRAPDANLHVVGNVHVADTTESFSTVTGAMTITGGLGVVGNVHAAQYHGDGSKLTGLVTTLEDVANNGNTMSNVIIFENETTGLVTDGKVGVSTRSPDANLHVVGNAYVSDVVTLASGLVTNRDQVVKKTYAYSGTITAGDQPFINVNFTSNIFYSKISAQLVDGNEELSTAILEVSGGSKNGVTPTKNISLGTMNIFGDVDNPNPWDEDVITTGNRVALRPLGTLVNTGEYHLFIEYTSPTADGGVTTVDEDTTSVITFGY